MRGLSLGLCLDIDFEPGRLTEEDRRREERGGGEGGGRRRIKDGRNGRMHTLCFFLFLIVDRTNDMKDRDLHIDLPLMNISHTHARFQRLAPIYLSRP